MSLLSAIQLARLSPIGWSLDPMRTGKVLEVWKLLGESDFCTPLLISLFIQTLTRPSASPVISGSGDPTGSTAPPCRGLPTRFVSFQRYAPSAFLVLEGRRLIRSRPSNPDFSTLLDPKITQRLALTFPFLHYHPLPFIGVSAIQPHVYSFHPAVDVFESLLEFELERAEGHAREDTHWDGGRGGGKGTEGDVFGEKRAKGDKSDGLGTAED